jgi:hypothetical protein
METCPTKFVWDCLFQVFTKSAPEGAKFRHTPSACGGDRNFEDFASLLHSSITVNDVAYYLYADKRHKIGSIE